MTERKHDSVAKAVSSIPRNSKGVPLYGAEAMREGWDTKANPWRPDCPEFSKWLSDWWGENANHFVSEEEVAEAANARLVAWAITGVLDTPAQRTTDCALASTSPQQIGPAKGNEER